MDSYEINNGTLAIIATGNGNSKILEDEKTYIIKKTPYEILDHSCKYFGSSYEGRKEGAKEIIGRSYKIPIVIEDTQRLVFFPTVSPEEKDCIWIAVNKILSYKQEKYSATSITFKNGKKVMIPLSFRAVQNQILRATRLSYILDNHKKIKF